MNKQLNPNPAADNVWNFRQFANAEAERRIKNGLPAKYISAADAPGEYLRVIKLLNAFADPTSEKHNVAYNAIKSEMPREAIDPLVQVGAKFRKRIADVAAQFQKSGQSAENAVQSAMNAVAGNPVYDHFANLNLLAGQLHEQRSFVETFLASDSFAVPIEAGGTGKDKTRFRAPYLQSTGSAKTYNGDINPDGINHSDNTMNQISLYNEFKNAKTIRQSFYINQDLRDQALGYESAVNPALAGFILQEYYLSESQEDIMKLAEIEFVGGQDPAGNYVPGVGGSYGIMSPAIQLLVGAGTDLAPAPASNANWLAAPTKLLQKIKNAIYKPTSVTTQFGASVNVTKMYQEIVRQFTVLATQNIDFKPAKWGLFVPSSWYGFAMQYPSSGTFNKTLSEMVSQATNGVINSIEVIPSSLMNYGASIGNITTQPYNYFLAVALGCESRKKPIIMPGRTVLPIVSSYQASSNAVRFDLDYLFGGPQFMHLGGAILLEFSVTGSD